MFYEEGPSIYFLLEMVCLTDTHAAPFRECALIDHHRGCCIDTRLNLGIFQNFSTQSILYHIFSELLASHLYLCSSKYLSEGASFDIKTYLRTNIVLLAVNLPTKPVMYFL